MEDDSHASANRGPGGLEIFLAFSIYCQSYLNMVKKHLPAYVDLKQLIANGLMSASLTH